MTQQTGRYVALMTVFATCALMIVLVIALGIDAATGPALTQALPLAVIGSVALAFLLADPFSTR